MEMISSDEPTFQPIVLFTFMCKMMSQAYDEVKRVKLNQFFLSHRQYTSLATKQKIIKWIKEKDSTEETFPVSP